MSAVRPALAYRWCSEAAAAEVMRSDRIPASWRHRVPWLGRDVAGASLSRNPLYEQACPIRLEFCLDGLRRSCRLLPLSADYVFDARRAWLGARDADPAQKYDRAARFDPIACPGHPFERDRADEEFAVGGIRQASRHLVGMSYRLGAGAGLVAAMSSYAARLGIPPPRAFPSAGRAPGAAPRPAPVPGLP